MEENGRDSMKGKLKTMANTKDVCIHCGKPQYQHGRFARCESGETQFEPASKSGDVKPEDRMFYVHGWGTTSVSGLYAFVPFPGKKSHWELALNETTEGRFQNPTSDKKPERITRVR